MGYVQIHRGLLLVTAILVGQAIRAQKILTNVSQTLANIPAPVSTVQALTRASVRMGGKAKTANIKTAVSDPLVKTILLVVTSGIHTDVPAHQGGKE
jgi:hypothetical protein